jgi:uncharacterized protein YdeI (YjbR/CyaY-like superfamily)
MKIRFFKTPAAFRQWLIKNHSQVPELWVGFYKKASGKPSITYHEALDEALCFGWIDGVRKRFDEVSYIQRFSPRKAKSTWSNINTKRAEELKQLGRMEQAGLDAFAARDPRRSGLYSFENKERKFGGEFEKRFRANKEAWKFFEGLPPSLKRVLTFYVMSAKKDATRWGRLERLIEASAQGIRLGVIDGSKSGASTAGKTGVKKKSRAT